MLPCPGQTYFRSLHGFGDLSVSFSDALEQDAVKPTWIRKRLKNPCTARGIPHHEWKPLLVLQSGKLLLCGPASGQATWTRTIKTLTLAANSTSPSLNPAWGPVSGERVFRNSRQGVLEHPAVLQEELKGHCCHIRQAQSHLQKPSRKSYVLFSTCRLQSSEQQSSPCLVGPTPSMSLFWHLQHKY